MEPSFVYMYSMLKAYSNLLVQVFMTRVNQDFFTYSHLQLSISAMISGDKKRVDAFEW